MTLHGEIGGEAALAELADGLYRRLLEDPVVSGWFDGIDLGRLKEHQRAFLAVGLDGPERYDGRSMRTAHSGLAITNEAFTAFVRHLSDSLTDLGVEPAVLRQVVKRIEAMRAVIVAVR